jgi:hypothetical protein
MSSRSPRRQSPWISRREPIRVARVAAGGVGTVPWRLPAVEQALIGRAPGHELFKNAAARAAYGAKPLSENEFKVELIKQTMEPAVGDRGAAAMTRPLPTALVAGPVTRVDGRLKVTGRALYAADNAIANVAYAALVCSSVARGTVERIDAAAAQRNPDVLRVITDFGGVNLPFDPRQVASFGQPVAVVVAATLEAATHACRDCSRADSRPAG